MVTKIGALSERLRDVLGEGDLLVGDTAHYAVDGRAPAAVAFPRTVEQVASVVRAAAAEGAAVIPVGGGTSLGIGGLPRAVDLVLSLARLDRAVEYDISNLTLTAQAGLTLPALGAMAAPHRQLLPLDPPLDDAATVGGVLAANASGPRRLLYGLARDLVLGLKVVLPDGTVVHAGGKTVKNVTGYDLTKLFIGSLGTLGAIVEATFRLWPRPETEKMIVASFDGLAPAATLAAKILDSELVPSALEILDPLAVEHVSNAVGAALRGRPRQAQDGGQPQGAAPTAGYCLLIGMEGFAEAVDRQAKQVSSLCAEAGAREVRTVEEPGVESMRAALRALPRLTMTSGPAVVAKASVPISQVAKASQGIAAAAECEGIRSAMQAGAGTGLVRAYLVAEGAEAETRLARAAVSAREVALSAGGSLVLEAAPPAVKEHVDAWGPVGEAFRLFRSVKQQMDPTGLFSPGRFVGGL